MALSDEQKSHLRASTYEAAIAFAEDMEYIREVLARRQTSRAEARRLSGVLRRLLVESDIIKIAVPRFQGRITFSAPDYTFVYNAARRLPCVYFAGGGVKVFGLDMSTISIFRTKQGSPPDHVREIYPPEADPSFSNKISLRLDNFLNQRVLCYHGKWVSRREIIKHVANIGSGVHSSSSADPLDETISQMRRSCIFRVESGTLVVEVLAVRGQESARVETRPAEGALPLDFQVADLDVVLVELLSTAELVRSSPDVQQLEKLVLAEVGHRQQHTSPSITPQS